MQRASGLPQTNRPPLPPKDPPAKHQGLSNGTSLHVTEPYAVNLQDALAEQKLRRRRTLESQAAEAGETRWALSFSEVADKASMPLLNVVTAGFGFIDALEPPAVQSDTTLLGVQSRRHVFLKSSVERHFNENSRTERSASHCALPRAASPDSRSTGHSSDLSETDMLAQPSQNLSPTVSKPEQITQRRAQAAGLAGRPRRRVNGTGERKHPDSISSGGGIGVSAAKFRCHECGKRGHREKHCPQAVKRSRPT